MKQRASGMTTAALASVMTGFVPVLAMLLISKGMDAVSILFYAYALAIPFVYLYLRRHGRYVAIGADRIIPICGISLVHALAVLCYYWSLEYMDIGISATLYYTYPLIVSLIMAGLFYERLSTAAFLCLLATLAGLWLLTGVSGRVHISTMGVILALVGSLLNAISVVFLNRAVMLGVSSMTISFWRTLTSTLAFGVLIILRGYAYVPTGISWLWLLLLAVVPTVCVYAANGYAMMRVGRLALSVLGFCEPLTALVAGYVIFGQRPSGLEIAGVLLVLVAVTVTIATRNVSRTIVRIHHLQPAVKRELHNKKP